MKKLFLLFVVFVTMSLQVLMAQCSLCTKTAMQLGEKPGRGLNAGILYLAFTPIAAASILFYRWWKREKVINADDNAIV